MILLCDLNYFKISKISKKDYLLDILLCSFAVSIDFRSSHTVLIHYSWPLKFPCNSNVHFVSVTSDA